MLLELGVGFALGVLLMVYALSGGPAREGPVFALGLVVAAMIYVGFGLAKGAPVRSLVLESLGVLNRSGADAPGAAASSAG